MIIRTEKESDIVKIFEITKEAFRNHPYSQGTEQFVIDALRRDGVLTISLVAEIDGKIVGHIAFSPVTISDGSIDWYGLGPVSVQPEFQRQGIGKALILEGLSRLKALGAQGCILVGNPAYYNRFGFKNFPNLTMKHVPQENVLALPFAKKIASGVIEHHPDFFIKG